MADVIAGTVKRSFVRKKEQVLRSLPGAIYVKAALCQELMDIYRFGTLMEMDDIWQNELIESRIECCLAGVDQFKDCPQLQLYIQTHGIQCVIGIHAWRAGSLLWDCEDVPYSIVFGGTDINKYYQDVCQMNTMTKAVTNARYLVAFSNPMLKQASSLWPMCEDKILLQPQAVTVNPSKMSFEKQIKSLIGYNLTADTSAHNSQVQEMIVFLLVGGLRRIKDPLFITQAVSDWHKQDNRIYLVIVGPELDEAYSVEVKTKVKELAGVILMPALQSGDVHAAIRDSFAVVNTSESEGMATALLEAMALNVAVVARNIPGNAAIIKHRDTGLLFDSPEEFVSVAKELIQSPSLRTTITTNAQEYTRTHHFYDDEKRTYASLVEKMVNN